jgi:hypothetical protein
MISRYKLLYSDWRGYLVALFALVYVTNFYTGLFRHVKLEVRKRARRDQGHRSPGRDQESGIKARTSLAGRSHSRRCFQTQGSIT